MSPDPIFERIEALLVREREALARMDAREIDRLTAEKQNLFFELAACGGWSAPDHAPRLRRAIDGARRNLLLLAAARDCVQGALAAAGVDPSLRTTFSVRG